MTEGIPSVVLQGRCYEAASEMKFPLELRMSAEGELEVKRKVAVPTLLLPRGMELRGQWAEVASLEDWLGDFYGEAMEE